MPAEHSPVPNRRITALPCSPIRSACSLALLLLFGLPLACPGSAGTPASGPTPPVDEPAHWGHTLSHLTAAFLALRRAPREADITTRINITQALERILGGQRPSRRPRMERPLTPGGLRAPPQNLSPFPTAHSPDCCRESTGIENPSMTRLTRPLTRKVVVPKIAHGYSHELIVTLYANGSVEIREPRRHDAPVLLDLAELFVHGRIAAARAQLSRRPPSKHGRPR